MSSTLHQRGPPPPPRGVRHRVPDGLTGDEGHEAQHQRQTRGQRQDQRPGVLARKGAVALDAVDAVGAPLDLPHGRGEVQQCEGQTEPEGERAPHAAAGSAPGAVEGVLDDAGAGTRHDPAEGQFDDAAHALRVHGGGQPDECHGARHQAQHDLEGQGACVGEPVRVPEPGDGVGQQPQPSVVAQRGERLVSGEFLSDHVPGLGDVDGRAHGVRSLVVRSLPVPLPRHPRSRTAAVPLARSDPCPRGTGRRLRHPGAGATRAGGSHDPVAGRRRSPCIPPSTASAVPVTLAASGPAR